MGGNAYCLVCFLIQSRATCSWPGSPTPIINQEDAPPTDTSRGRSDGGSSSIEIPTSQVIKVSVKWTETKQSSSQGLTFWSQALIVKCSVDCLAPRKASINRGDNQKTA